MEVGTFLVRSRKYDGLPSMPWDKCSLYMTSVRYEGRLSRYIHRYICCAKHLHTQAGKLINIWLIHDSRQESY